MKTVQIEICKESWVAPIKSGGMPWTYFGGYYNLKYRDTIKGDYYVSSYNKEFPFLESLTFHLAAHAISQLQEQCNIELILPNHFYTKKEFTKWLKTGLGESYTTELTNAVKRFDHKMTLK
ncbi:MAG: hypothetical protein A2Y23_08425 [Clostridiales bacterium GWB2_37_7]|nr:MAG: hypothetical protein A2Y23_08425 [Clostridiales bacterium GWB2_37_7]